jgi:hypothetical protein
MSSSIDYSPVIPEVDCDYNKVIIMFVCLLCVMGGLALGLRFRQVICKTCQPIIHNLHKLYPLQLVPVNEMPKEDTEETPKMEVPPPAEEPVKDCAHCGQKQE